MVFTVKKVETSTFGEKLKKAREEAGLTKQKVAQLLNIQIKYLERLEEEEIEKLPADVYTRGFLKKYAQLLGVEGDDLVAAYEKEIRIVQPLTKKSYRSLPRLQARWFTITPKTLSVILASVLFILIIAYLFYQLNILISPPKLVVEEPIDDLTTDKTTIIFRGQTEPGAQLTINGQQIYINIDGVFEQQINLDLGLNLIKVEATNRFEKSRAVVRQIMVE